jgi:putative membrane protein
MMDWGDGAWSWWWMLPMMLFMIVLVGALIWALVGVTRSKGATTEARRPTAEEILNERFARGEVDASEYAERLDALRGRRAKTRS